MAQSHNLSVGAAGNQRVQFDEVEDGVRPGSVAALVKHVLRLAKMDELTLSRAMSTPQARSLVGGATLVDSPDAALLQRWDQVKDARPEPLTDQEYAAFLEGHLGVEVGAVYEGTVAKVVDFGAFVTIADGQEGLVHISQIAEGRVEHVSDLIHEGQAVRVKVLEVAKDGKIKLSMKAAEPQPVHGSIATHHSE